MGWGRCLQVKEAARCTSIFLHPPRLWGAGQSGSACPSASPWLESLHLPPHPVPSLGRSKWRLAPAARALGSQGLPATSVFLQSVPTKLSLYVWLGPLGVCGVVCVPLSNPGWCEPSGCLMGSQVQSSLCATRQEKPVSSQHPKRPDSQRPMHYPKTPLQACQLRWQTWTLTRIARNKKLHLQELATRVEGGRGTWGKVGITAHPARPSQKHSWGGHEMWSLDFRETLEP